MNFGRDLSAAVWGDLKGTPPTRRVQRGYMTAARTLLQGWAKGGADEEAQARIVSGVIPMSGAAARAVVESGDDTVFVPCLRASLPGLKARLEAASRSTASEADRLPFAEMAVQVARLQKIGMP